MGCTARQASYECASLQDLRKLDCRWADRPTEQVINSIAAATDGFAGADLQALATAAVMAAVGRAAPDLVDSFVTDPNLQNRTGAAGPKPRRLGALDALKGVKVCSLKASLFHVSAQNKGDTACMSFCCMDLWPVCLAQRMRNRLAVRLPLGCGDLWFGEQVRLSDWRTALSRAPPPCSRRQGMSALAAASASPLPYHLAPLLLPALHRSILAVHESCMSLTASVATATTAAAALDRGRLEELETRLREAGAVHGPPGTAQSLL